MREDEDLECSRPFRGIVFSGKGEGSFYVSIYARNFRKKLGFTPYPGTLNVKLIDNVDNYLQCINYINKIIIEPPKINNTKLARVIAYKIYINNIQVYAIKPEITIYKNNVIEIISDKYLRKELNLKDGDIVYISLSKKSLE